MNVEYKYTKDLSKPQKFNILKPISIVFLILSLSSLSFILVTQIKSLISKKHNQNNPIEIQSYYPELSYFQNISNNAHDIMSPNIKIDYTYNKEFFISIQSIEINSLKITPNVSYQNENDYKQALKEGLAHFKYTSLPGDGGNIVVYGHSVTEKAFIFSYNNPGNQLNKLDKIDLGNIIEITKDDIVYKYEVKSIKILKPDDLSIINNQLNIETLTLITCYPWGIGTERFVVIASRIN